MRLKMYGELAPWFHLLTAPKDYAEEAAVITSIIERLSTRDVREVLELGSGGGNNASHMKARFTLTLTDVSEEMLALSKTINPECEHIAGDMRSIRIGRTFDAVLVHDAISYMTSERDLVAAMTTAAVHLEPGGVAVFCPDDVAETYRSRTKSGGHDGADGRAMRYLHWDHPADGTSHRSSFVYVLHEPGRPVRVEHEQHTLGLFERATWTRLIAEAGLEPHRVEGPDWRGEGPTDIFAGVKRGASLA